MLSLDQFAREKLTERAGQNLRRSIVETGPGDGVHVVRNGRTLLSFCSNDYLNLSQHPAVKQAAANAAEKYGAGAGASRLVTGSHPLYTQLEQRLAHLKGAEAACVFGSGYLANTGIIPALAGRGDLLLLDELAHASMTAGARLSGADVHVFRHNDVAHAQSLLDSERGTHRHALIVTEGVFSMDGDLAPLLQLSQLAEQYDAWLMSDDAHGIGVVGQGRGSAFVSSPPAIIPLQMGTLSKAIGSYGGYLCGSRDVIDLMHNRARTLIYSTGLPPAVIAAAIAALDIIEADPDYAALPLRKARDFTRSANLPFAESPIVPVKVGAADAALKAAQMLEDEGFLVVAIRPPTVPDGTARLRITFNAAQPDEDIARLADIVRTRIGGHA
ncbi:8-amino-7-oxononanoate synthase [Pseudorhodoplanes sinuspersici]|uniref:8-amino-7-ketopelargonate synthase n=1 Tax=Pseudorhodoplanes sinuspersici TaxID=1235591 RepID=A0A1W6ZZY4_9HYPH|nr:8-amino-7-oxononanoate synthase [Pseudorhodoplanes sinuspersici]ARQ02932.1 8-amino-7-oxononanoate synthase [Pseudorhodoplanes sinuspersici]